MMGVRDINKVLIFGVSGFVGTYLAREFIKSGYKVIGNDIKRIEDLPAEMEFHEVDILDYEGVESSIREASPSIIVNLVAICSVAVSWKIPQEIMSINLIGSINILEAVRTIDENQKVLLIGSSEEYGNVNEPISEKHELCPNNPYGISKVAQEKMAEIYRNQYGMKVYCVRAFNHIGVGQSEAAVLPSFCKQIANINKSGKSGVIHVGNLSAIRDFTDVRDVVRAYRMILESDDCKEIYNIGSGRSYKLSELLDYIVSLGSQKIKIEVDPDRIRPIDTPIVCSNNEKIKTKLGWIPEYSVFDTLEEMYSLYYK